MGESDSHLIKARPKNSRPETIGMGEQPKNQAKYQRNENDQGNLPAQHLLFPRRFSSLVHEPRYRENRLGTRRDLWGGCLWRPPGAPAKRVTANVRRRVFPMESPPRFRLTSAACAGGCFGNCGDAWPGGGDRLPRLRWLPFCLPDGWQPKCLTLMAGA